MVCTLAFFWSYMGDCLAFFGWGFLLFYLSLVIIGLSVVVTLSFRSFFCSLYWLCLVVFIWLMSLWWEFSFQVGFFSIYSIILGVLMLSNFMLGMIWMNSCWKVLNFPLLSHHYLIFICWPKHFGSWNPYVQNFLSNAKFYVVSLWLGIAYNDWIYSILIGSGNLYLNILYFLLVSISVQIEEVMMIASWRLSCFPLKIFDILNFWGLLAWTLSMYLGVLMNHSISNHRLMGIFCFYFVALLSYSGLKVLAKDLVIIFCY